MIADPEWGEGSETPEALSVRGLTKTYQDGRKDPVTAVKSLSFSVRQGQTVGLLGGNGAGKTTTIAMLLGLLLPTSGEIRVLGVDMIRDRYRALARMNFSSPYVELPHRLTVRENLTVFARLYGLRRPKDRIAALAEELDLLPFLDRASGKLSAGQKTRVAVAKALLNDPDLLLLDEPTASLDPDTGDRVRTRLEDWRAGDPSGRKRTIFLASHNMAEVERLCDHVMILQRGEVRAEGSPPELIARFGRQTLEDVFLDIAREHEQAPALASEPGQDAEKPA
ncbi:MAG: ABC transporter ATP-binding protein [Rhodospirillaceae bacterium]